MSHWFDGFSQTHRFELCAPESEKYVTKVKYNSRHGCHERMERLRKTGDLTNITFGQQQDPCKSFFRKAMSYFYTATLPKGNGLEDNNIGVTVHPNSKGFPSNRESQAETIWIKTDSAALQELDPATLEPIGVTNQTTLHPDLRGSLSASHMRTDPATGDYYNYNLELGSQAVYRVFHVSASTGKTEILATISSPNIRGAYLHSTMITEKYIILCLYDAYYIQGGAKMLFTKNMVDALEFDPNQKNKWLVIDRLHGKGLVGIFESDPFFAFHCVNSWDQPSGGENGGTDIIADISTYENLDILKRFFYKNIKSTSPTALDYVGENSTRARPRIQRFKLPAVGDTTISPDDAPCGKVELILDVPIADSVELPTFNPKYCTKPSRYIYGVSDKANSVFLDGLTKYDTETRTAKSRVVHAHSPGEPIFVADPEGREEDDGVLLSVVLDGTSGKSYLLVLDAKTFEEVGRASMEVAVTFGFHGKHMKRLVK
ncbi:MAG: hypothetical protein Q9190_007473 [Brigantiaea leucoxantha]